MQKIGNLNLKEIKITFVVVLTVVSGFFSQSFSVPIDNEKQCMDFETGYNGSKIITSDGKEYVLNVQCQKIEEKK